MKKKIIITSLGLLSLFGMFALSSNTIADNAEDGYCNNGRCSATTNAGTHCKNCAQSGSYYCWSHR